MDSLRNFYWKRWIKKRNCKLAGGVLSLSKRTELILEEGVALGHVDIDSPHLMIGAHTYIRSESHLSLVSSIGRFCSMGTGVVIGQEKHTHPTTWLSSHPFQYTASALTYHARTDMATIGHDVWIGSNAMILEGVTVGTGAVIATRAVVVEDVPPYAIVAGVPAKVVRFRHPPEMIERLLASRWWEMDVNHLKTLALNDPAVCMTQLELKRPATAQYRKISVTRRGCREGCPPGSE
ncbi:CatB-related O-acetyltransferase [Pseudomonas citri]|uniref:CatB-related O-acetyltransferase n=1 Tax=Pseudomonas citri TaxID=2978349 RepID=UPI0021B4FC99|nr:CatB-related O-acetyltransferase [Pseudomonas citri]